MNQATILEALIKTVIVMGGLATGAAYLVLLERKMAAWVQDRIGPNRVGIPLTKIRLFGLGQPLADGLKIMFKEDFTPAHVDRRLFTLAPIIILVAAFAAFAVIPFGSLIPTNLGVEGIEEPIRLVVAPGVNVGVLYVFAVSSIAVYGVILGGWASNNKYSFLGGLRSSAQLIAYELPMGLGLLGVVVGGRFSRPGGDHDAAGRRAAGICCCSRSDSSSSSWRRLPRRRGCRSTCPSASRNWWAVTTPSIPACGCCLFLLTEFLHMITAALLIVILFLGGWHLPFGLTGYTDEVGWFGAIARVVVLLAQGHGRDSDFHAGALELAALSVRPIDGAGLEGHVAAGHGQLRGRGGLGPGPHGVADWRARSGRHSWPPPHGACASDIASSWLPSPRPASADNRVRRFTESEEEL